MRFMLRGVWLNFRFRPPLDYTRAKQAACLVNLIRLLGFTATLRYTRLTTHDTLGDQPLASRGGGGQSKDPPPLEG